MGKISRWGLVIALCVLAVVAQAQDYPYVRHVPHIGVHKSGYERLVVRTDTSAAYWYVGVQTGILPNWYVLNIQPSLMVFPGAFLERGYRHYRPNGHFWDLVIHTRYTFLRWSQPDPTIGTFAFWEGHGNSTGVKVLYGLTRPAITVFGREIPWHIYGGVGLQINTRYQRDYLSWSASQGRYVGNEQYALSVLPSPTLHLTVRPGHGR